LSPQAYKSATWTGADVGVTLFSPSGKPCSYDSTSIENIIDNFFDVALEDRQRDYVDVKSNVFEAFEHLYNKLQALNKKEKKWILLFKIMHYGSE